MVPPDDLVDDDPVFLEPTPDGLQNDLGGLPLVAYYKNEDVFESLLLHLPVLVVVEIPVNKLDHLALVPNAVDNLPHLYEILKVDGFVHILLVFLVLADEAQSAQDLVSLVLSFGAEVYALLDQNSKL